MGTYPEQCEEDALPGIGGPSATLSYTVLDDHGQELTCELMSTVPRCGEHVILEAEP